MGHYELDIPFTVPDLGASGLEGFTLISQGYHLASTGLITSSATTAIFLDASF
jgi:hypothetical protein